MTIQYWVEKGTLTDERVDGLRTVLVGGEKFRWSNNGHVPAVGEMLTVIMNAFGRAMVHGYFTQDGFFGVIVKPVTLPDWYVKQNEGRGMVRPQVGIDQICVFGAEVKLDDRREI